MSDLKVLEVDPVTHSVMIKFSSSSVSGIDLLIQIVVIRLLSTVGRDLLDEDIGGGINDLVGMNYDPSDLSEVYSEVARKVSKVQQEIISEQIGVTIPAEEKLSQIIIVSLAAGTEAGEVTLRLRIENEIGRTRDVVI